MKNSVSIILFISFFILCSFVKENNAYNLQIESNYETHFFKTSDGLNLRYLKSGEGPAIIFQPGWMMPAEVFEPQLKQLSKYFKVIALDPRGHGLSDDCPNDNYVKRRAQDILELVQHEEIESFMLAGWSLGVADILSYVENYNSNKLKALILIDGPVSTDDEFVQTSWKNILNNLQIQKNAFKENFVSSLFSSLNNETLQDTIRERLKNTTINSSFVALATHIMEPKDYSQVINNLDIPVLITVAAWTFQLDKFKELKGDITIENFKIHALFIDESEKFNKLIIELKGKAFSK